MYIHIHPHSHTYTHDTYTCTHKDTQPPPHLQRWSTQAGARENDGGGEGGGGAYPIEHDF